VLGSPVVELVPLLEFEGALALFAGLLPFDVGFTGAFEEDGGRQKSSNRSAWRDECM
jgi:hypothetical protein